MVGLGTLVALCFGWCGCEETECDLRHRKALRNVDESADVVALKERHANMIRWCENRCRISAIMG